MTAASWPADRVERRPLAALTPCARNSRTHSERQIAQIAASIREWGWTMPVLVDEADEIIAGHGRVRAAETLGLTEAPVMVARGWTEAQRRAYVIADNRLAEAAGWDEALLGEELNLLAQGGFELELTGFDGAELDRLLSGGGHGREDEDEVPEPPAEPITRPGDLWILGAHRLLCGDSTDAAQVARLLGGVRPHLMVTDPPYGVNYEPDWRNKVVRADGSAVSARATGTVQNDHRADWREAWALFPGDVAYVWHADRFSGAVLESLEATSFEARAQIIWAKPRLVIGRGHYHHQHEPCWYAVRKGKGASWKGDRKQTTLWSIEHRKSETGHGTQKPVEAMRRPILNHSAPGQAVYEPFCGSGTTLIACETEGRACLGMEIDPAYCDVIVKRWEELTGETARREEAVSC
ncbi:site-specific DNA-methyltransferase [Rhodovulum sp. DZ06]|uniref:site-specific DNA-methyltransferase n=1 Tax=Rhodovulum sp. DZ06 TaxID=3425126 RepID=UPI003D359340